VSTGKQIPTFRRSLLLYIQCTGRLGRLLISVGKNSTIVISGFCRREVDVSSVFLGYYAEGGGNSVPTIRENHSVPSSGVKRQKKPTPENGTCRVSRNVGKELPLLA